MKMNKDQFFSALVSGKVKNFKINGQKFYSDSKLLPLILEDIVSNSNHEFNKEGVRDDEDYRNSKPLNSKHLPKITNFINKLKKVFLSSSIEKELRIERAHSDGYALYDTKDIFTLCKEYLTKLDINKYQITYAHEPYINNNPDGYVTYDMLFFTQKGEKGFRIELVSSIPGVNVKNRDPFILVSVRLPLKHYNTYYTVELIGMKGKYHPLLKDTKILLDSIRQDYIKK